MRVGSVSIFLAVLVLGTCAHPVLAQTIDVQPDASVQFTFEGFQGGPFLPGGGTSWTVDKLDILAADFTVSSNQAWLKVSPSQGSTGMLVAVEVEAALDQDEAAALSPGVYTGTVTFTNITNGAGTTTRSVSLTVAVASLSVSPLLVNTTATENGANPSPVAVTLGTTGATALNYALTWEPEFWFNVSKTNGTVRGGGSDTFAISFNTAGLSPGTSHAVIAIENTTNGAGNAQLIVSLTVVSAPTGGVTVLPDSDLDVRGPAGDLPSVLQSYMVVNSGSTTVRWRAIPADDWVSISPLGGELAPNDGSPGGLDEIEVNIRVNAAASELLPGSHASVVTFEIVDTKTVIASRVAHVTVDPVLTLPLFLVGGSLDTVPSPQSSSTAGSTARHAFSFGEVVLLTAQVEDGHQFAGWIGDVPEELSMDNPIAVTMDASKSVAPVIVPIQYTLTMSASGTGTGTVKPTPTGAFTENSLISRYTGGAVVSLSAEADAGSVFVGWAGNITTGQETTNPIEVEMDRDRTITARFEPGLSLTVLDASGGRIEVEPAQGAFIPGSEVTITAVPDEGFVFIGWAGDFAGETTSLSFVISNDTTVEALFAVEGSDGTEPPAGEGDARAFRLNVEVQGDGMITPSSGTFFAGATVTLIATPDDGWTFVGWEGDTTGSQLTTQVSMDSDKTVRAVFVVSDEAVGRPVDVTTTPMCGAMGLISLMFCFLGCHAFRGVRMRWWAMR